MKERIDLKLPFSLAETYCEKAWVPVFLGLGFAGQGRETNTERPQGQAKLQSC